MVQANTAGRDPVGVVTAVRRAVGSKVLPTPQPDYFVEYGGQFDAQRQANRPILFLGEVATLLFYKALGSWRAALQVLVNVPPAAIGLLLLALGPGRPASSLCIPRPWWSSAA